MATTLIRNGLLSGIIGGINMGRARNSFDPAAYATDANVADAIATECITRNAQLSVPMADADSAYIGEVCRGAAIACCANIGSGDSTATDYVALANNIVALAKACVSKLV